jgi:hypothetical protein
MSTKIYTGFKIDTIDILEVQAILNEHHKSVKEITKEKIIEHLIKSAVKEFDRDTIEKKDTDKNYISEANYDMEDRQKKIKQTMSRDPEVDFDAEIAIFPFEGKFYGIYYTEKEEFYDNLLTNSKVVEFSYWNSTDHPKNITKQEWEEREKIWDTIFKGNELPCEIGFTKKYNSYPPQPSIEEIIAKWDSVVPKFEKRLKYWSNIVYAEREFNKLSEKERSSISNYMRIDRDDSDAANAKREEVKKELKEIMVKKLTPESLGLPVENLRKNKMRM